MYDYVVIGAGSAGCVVASRLTEDTKTRVLLLEAGGPDSRREIHIPAAFSRLFKTSCDWAYYTEDHPAVHNRRLYWPRGKMLGGSSSINAMIYIRGHPRDYDEWRDLGNHGWGFADVLPYFKKGENQERGASEYHGAGGPMNVADLRYINPLSHAFVEASVEVGIPRNSDFNGPTQDGVGFYQVTQKRGKRHGAAGAYLGPAMRRSNLTVLTHAHVTRVLFQTARAAGVVFARHGQTHQVQATREVILCAGAVNSPQLLMLSGIGSKEELEKLRIPVVADLPGVGQNLQDHIVVGAAYACTQPISLASADSIGNLLKYVLFKRGPLTSNVAEAGGFVKSAPHLPFPDLQLLFGPVYFIDHGFTRPEGHGFSLGAYLLRPKSRGSLTLHSSDPLEPPLIRSNYLIDEADLRPLVAGFKLVRRIVHSRAFDPFRGGEFRPGAQVQSDEDIVACVRGLVESQYHPVGTCKMGTDRMSVVNSRLEAHGVQGLRVVDASVMPTIVGGNTNAPTLMIAEKAADMIVHGQ